MVKFCKYQEEEREKSRCSNKFIFYTKSPFKYYCRLSEWKKKRGVCPYDSKISSLGYQLERRKRKAKKVGDNQERLIR